MSKLVIHTIGLSETLKEQFSSSLIDDRYMVDHHENSREAYDIIVEKKENIDCLIIQYDSELDHTPNQLSELRILLPSLIFFTQSHQAIEQKEKGKFLYHSAEQYISFENLRSLTSSIDQAIAQFLNLAPSCALSDNPTTPEEIDSNNQQQNFLLLQQRRLAEKLRERLGYLGVYYKRNPQYFYRNLSEEEQRKFKQDFIADYREIVLDYFNGAPPTNQAIDQFVNQAFFADVSVSYILETHMALMDDFAQQLKLEGRSEEILLDYRLTLIDIVAHLCEMYRRSIPREDLPFELLMRMD
ncbi:circadian clock protein KaiA [[Leptolyngbya] sp. PCC 7376]|uniref:circadian clock protein KaiA n=1 Tax=[Leptolyngbya] sp. PCC 7376 TaxID=111781 RepID=UPI0037D9D419